MSSYGIGSTISAEDKSAEICVVDPFVQSFNIFGQLLGVSCILASSAKQHVAVLFPSSYSLISHCCPFFLRFISFGHALRLSGRGF